jgi:hypothetical protein
MPRRERESQCNYAERLKPMAEALAAKEKLVMPYKDPSTYEPAWPFLLTYWGDDPNDSDDGYGCRQVCTSSEWAQNPAHAAQLLQEHLRYGGYGHIKLYDIDRGEQCYFEVGVRVKYKALANLTADAGPDGMFPVNDDMSPALGGRDE